MCRKESSSKLRAYAQNAHRYLTQLSDQIVALVSTEQAKSFVWDSNIRNTEMQAARDAEDDDDDDTMRMFSFEVSKSEEQEDNVTASEGFQVSLNKCFRAKFTNTVNQQKGGCPFTSGCCEGSRPYRR